MEVYLNTQIKLAKPRIPFYSASGKRQLVGIETIRILKTADRVARLIQRKKDKAITRGYLRAEPNEIAVRITASPTVIRELPMTWTHSETLLTGNT